MMCMTPRQTQAYHRQVDRLQATEDLRALDLLLAPHMSKDGREELVRSLMRRARPDKKVRAVPLDAVASFVNKLNARANGRL
jgi:hypothetical protein